MEEVLRPAARDRKVWRIQEHPGSTHQRADTDHLFRTCSASLTGFDQNLNLLSSFIVTRITGKKSGSRSPSGPRGTLKGSQDRMLLPLSQPFLPQRMDGWRQNEETDRQQRSGVMSVCTFLPQLAQTPVEQSQDKANEYGLDRLQYGWLEGREEEGRGGGRRRRGITRNQPANQPKPTWRMEQLQSGGQELLLV